jgi:hypothetical protein
VTNGVKTGRTRRRRPLWGARGCARGARAGRTDIASGEQYLIAEFPQEWLRDPECPYLTTARTDMPWDDPAVMRAMVAMRAAC